MCLGFVRSIFTNRNVFLKNVMLVHFFQGGVQVTPKQRDIRLGAMSKLVVPSADQPLPFSNDVSIVRPSTVEASINIADALSTNGLHCLIPVIARTTLASRYRIVMSLPGLPCYRTCRVPRSAQKYFG